MIPPSRASKDDLDGVENSVPKTLLKVEVGKTKPQGHAKKKDKHPALKDAATANGHFSNLREHSTFSGE